MPVCSSFLLSFYLSLFQQGRRLLITQVTANVTAATVPWKFVQTSDPAGTGRAQAERWQWAREILLISHPVFCFQIFAPSDFAGTSWISVLVGHKITLLLQFFPSCHISTWAQMETQQKLWLQPNQDGFKVKWQCHYQPFLCHISSCCIWNDQDLKGQHCEGLPCCGYILAIKASSSCTDYYSTIRHHLLTKEKPRSEQI